VALLINRLYILIYNYKYLILLIPNRTST